MKKTLIFSAFLLFSLVLLTGCGNGEAKNNQTTGDKTGTPTAIEANNIGRPGRNNQPDFGQPERAADVRGIVKSIVGNEANILKIERGNGRASSTEAMAGGSENKAAVSLTRTPGVPAGGPGGGMGGGMGGPGGGMGGTQDATSRAAMLAALKEMSTGEEKVIIPVGIKMLKSSTDGTKREMVEANLSDITNDKMITIWLNQSVTDKKVAEFVLIN
ncbi:MAG: hypothetical protein WCT50_01385 [Patescibacteria group bacterium]|jgi:hypothetical protein